MSKTDQNVTHQIRSEQVSKQENRSSPTAGSEIKFEPTQDFFVAYKHNVDKYFENMESSIPKYYATIHELQQEYLQVWENMFNAAMKIQKEFASKSGMNSKESTAASQFVSDVTQSAINMGIVRDKIILKSIDTAKENVMTWNKQTQGYAETNTKIAQFWASLFAARKT